MRTRSALAGAALAFVIALAGPGIDADNHPTATGSDRGTVPADGPAVPLPATTPDPDPDVDMTWQ